MSPEREIENLIYRYAELIDDGDMDTLAGLFSRARFLDPSGEVQGEGSRAIGAIYRAFTRVFPEGTPRTHHVTTNVIIEVANQTAEARSYFTVFQATSGLPLQPIIAGRYHDTFALDANGWYFTSRQVFSRLAGDLSEHLLGPIPEG
ncbi:nuclear transport factor 2 family protein [Halioglobus maricola]|uniref:Nuclear transport factor 2 family protein n=1 Tax=Halioglobus maricola TaxID=2601894 RepID=A0A5P9NN69_9GAMM|nr:nuclear transport factor 2 family protein [Halioglobus maricola]QFU77270.1 nuclear transport factor 2 family protein [Halioglobus maricola]